MKQYRKTKKFYGNSSRFKTHETAMKEKSVVSLVAAGKGNPVKNLLGSKHIGTGGVCPLFKTHETIPQGKETLLKTPEG
jgi:hypothetical protein